MQRHVGHPGQTEYQNVQDVTDVQLFLDYLRFHVFLPNLEGLTGPS